MGKTIPNHLRAPTLLDRMAFQDQPAQQLSMWAANKQRHPATEESHMHQQDTQ